jgi:hypothetical protein
MPHLEKGAKKIIINTTPVRTHRNQSQSQFCVEKKQKKSNMESLIAISFMQEWLNKIKIKL